MLLAYNLDILLQIFNLLITIMSFIKFMSLILYSNVYRSVTVDPIFLFVNVIEF